jgi:hypothetical protein
MSNQLTPLSTDELETIAGGNVITDKLSSIWGGIQNGWNGLQSGFTGMVNSGMAWYAGPKFATEMFGPNASEADKKRGQAVIKKYLDGGGRLPRPKMLGF